MCHLHHLWPVLVCSAFLLVHGPAAKASDDGKPGLYLEAGASPYLLEMPDYAPIYTRNLAPGYEAIAPLSVFDDDAVGALGSLTLGRRTATPLFFELTGHTFRSRSNTLARFNYADYGVDAIGIAWPSGTNPAYFASTVTVVTSTDARFSDHGGRLLAGYALDLGRGITVSPFAGGEFMRLGQKYDLKWQSLTQINLREKVNADYAGLLVGARLRARWGDYEAGLTGSVGGYWVHSAYSGTMTVTNSSRSEDTLSIRDDDPAMSLELAADLSRKWGPLSIGIHGGMRHLSFVPRIVGGTRDPTLYTSGTLTHLEGYVPWPIPSGSRWGIRSETDTAHVRVTQAIQPTGSHQTACSTIKKGLPRGALFDGADARGGRTRVRQGAGGVSGAALPGDPAGRPPMPAAGVSGLRDARPG